MRFDWSPLRSELEKCRRDNIAISFWWRDDDAIAPSKPLDHLQQLAVSVGLPVHLAIIPEHASSDLARLTDGTVLIPVVHGWAHEDHSRSGEKKNEFMTVRQGLKCDATRAMDRMNTLFGARLQHMFVPPWNRIHPTLPTMLADIGYSTLSTFGPRAAEFAAPGLRQINTHIDPIWWKGNRDLVDPIALISRTISHLSARRQGQEDAEEPFGLLTHHLVHTSAIWAFTYEFITEMLLGGAAPWTMEKDI